MKIKIGGILYDTDTARKLAHLPSASGDQQLYQTADGDYFLVVLQAHIDGRKLEPHESWVDLGNTKTRKSRITVRARFTPLVPRQALEWCVKTQIPLPLRGYLLDCI